MLIFGNYLGNDKNLDRALKGGSRLSGVRSQWRDCLIWRKGGHSRTWIWILPVLRCDEVTVNGTCNRIGFEISCRYPPNTYLVCNLWQLSIDLGDE